MANYLHRNYLHGMHFLFPCSSAYCWQSSPSQWPIQSERVGRQRTPEPTLNAYVLPITDTSWVHMAPYKFLAQEWLVPQRMKRTVTLARGCSTGDRVLPQGAEPWLPSPARQTWAWWPRQGEQENRKAHGHLLVHTEFKTSLGSMGSHLKQKTKRKGGRKMGRREGERVPKGGWQTRPQTYFSLSFSWPTGHSA